MKMWGVKGGPPPIFGAKSYFLCYLERHAKIQNRRKTHQGEKYVEGQKKERKKNIAFAILAFP